MIAITPPTMTIMQTISAIMVAIAMRPFVLAFNRTMHFVTILKSDFQNGTNVV